MVIEIYSSATKFVVGLLVDLWMGTSRVVFLPLYLPPVFTRKNPYQDLRNRYLFFYPIDLADMQRPSCFMDIQMHELEWPVKCATHVVSNVTVLCLGTHAPTAAELVRLVNLSIRNVASK